MFEFGLSGALDFRDDALGKYFAQLYSPLIKRVNVPYGALGEDTMLVYGHQFAERGRCKAVHQEGVRWTIALENPVRNEPGRCALPFYLLHSLAEGECFGLSEDIRHEHVMVALQPIERMRESNEIRRNELG